ncbi:MAG: penicillin-insensitive murein endopeptidase [Myxococcota bacterium]
MSLVAVVFIVLLAAGGGVATALFVSPRATQAAKAVSSATVHADGEPEPEAESVEPEPEPESGEGGEVAVAAAGSEIEPEIPVGDVEEPAPEDPDDAIERAPAVEPKEPVKVPANEPLELDLVDIEFVDGDRPWVLHKLAPFETVDQVAYRHDVKPTTVRTWNGLGPDVQKLKPGSRLKLKARRVPPPRQKFKYTVQPGDTWWSIAVAYAIDSKVLRASNWQASKRLTVGEELNLWVDPAVYNWVQTDRPAIDDEDLLSNIRRGAVSIGPTSNGRLINGVQIPPGEGWRRKRIPSSYGTTHAVTHLIAAMQEFHRTSGYERDLLLGSMSRRHGGKLDGHLSHQSGRDIDIRLPLSTEHPPWFPIKPWRVDYKALWTLVAALADTGEVLIIFLDYELQKSLHKAAADMGIDKDVRRRMIQWPRGESAKSGLIRHVDGHEAHIHVRFRCGPHETECVAGNAYARRDG